MAERGSKKVLLNASPWGTLDTLYPKTTVDLIHTKDASVKVFPEILPENTSEYLVMTSAGVFVFTDRVGKVDDVLVISSESGEQGVSVVDDKTAKIHFAPGLIVNSDGSIMVDRGVFATNADLNAFHDEFIMTTSELDDKLDSEIARSTRRDSELDDKVNRLNSEMLDRVDEMNSEIHHTIDTINSEINDRITRLNSEMLDRVDEMNSEIHYTIDNINSEINDRITELDDRLTSELAAEIERATNSEAYIISRLDAEILRATNSEQFIINKINALDLPTTFLVRDTTDSNGNLTYRIPRTITQTDGQVILSSEGITLGSAASLDYIQSFNDSESIAKLRRLLPTAEAVRAYVGDGTLDVKIRRGGVLTSEGFIFKANQDTNKNFEFNIPSRVTDLADSSEYYIKSQIDNKFNRLSDVYLKKFDSEGILDTSEHNVLGAINEVFALTRDLGNNKQDKVGLLNAGNGITITVKGNGQLDKISIKPTLNANPTIIVDSSGIRGNYRAGTGLELENNNKFNVLYDNDTIKINSEGEIYFAQTIEDMLPSMAAKQGKALIVDSSGHLSWGEAGKVDIVELDGSESRAVLSNKVVTIQQIDASIIKGVVQAATKATYDSAGNIITTTYQRIDNMTAGITSEGNKYPSNRAVYNALNLKQDKLSAGNAIDRTNLNSDVVSVRYDGTTIVLDIPAANSEGNLQARNIKLNGLVGKPYLTAIIPTDTRAGNPPAGNMLVNNDELNDKIRDALGNYVGLFTSEGYIPRTGVAKNDYAYVTTKNSEGESFLSRYKCQQTSEGAPITWAVEYTISLGKEILFTTRQAAALNSGINEYLVSGSEGLIIHLQRTDNPHNVTAAQLGLGPFANKSINQVVSEGLTAALIENKMGGTVITQTRGDARYKKIQTAVSDPTAAAGNVISFIASITQNAQGVITPTKKTIPDVTSTRSGLMTPAQKTKLDSIEDGATRVQRSNINGNIKINGSESTVYTLPIASSTRLGGVKIGNKINIAADGTISTDGTTYTFTNGTDGSFFVTPAGGTAQKVTVLPLAGSEGNGKYLKKNATTGNIEWASGPAGGGGSVPNDGALVIKVNGSSVAATGGTFTADKGSQSTYDITVPVAGTGLTTGTASGRTNVFNHSNSITAVTTIPTTSINNLKYDAQGHITGTASVTGDTTNGIQIVGSKIQHTNVLAAANTTNGLKYFTYDKNGHVTAAVNKTLGRGISDSSNVIGHSNTAITANTTNSLKTFTYDTYGHVTAGTNKTLGRGINDSSNVIGHSNTAVSAVTTQSLRKITYDTYGHITGSAVITSEDIEPYVSVQADRGLNVSAGKVGHSNTAITAGTLNNNTSTVSDWSTAATYGVIVSQAPYNAYGHITSKTDRTYTIGQSNWDNNTTTSFPYVRNRPNIRLNGHTSGTGMNATGTVIGYSGNIASGNYSLAAGGGAASGEATTASGVGSFATGLGSVASGNGAVSFRGKASGVCSFSVGYGSDNVAAGPGTITAGNHCTTDSNSSDAIAAGSYAQIGRYGQDGAFSLGDHTYNGADHGTVVTGYYTRLENGNVYRITSKNGTEIGGAFVNGSYNNTTKASKDNLNLIAMTGIGDSDSHRANGMALTTKGDLRIKGNVYVGCNDDSTGGTIAGGNKHYGTFILPASAKGTKNVTPTFSDGYKLDGTEHPILDLVPTTIDNVETELSNWAAVYKATSNSNKTITVYLKYATTSSITIQVLV